MDSTTEDDTKLNFVKTAVGAESIGGATGAAAALGGTSSLKHRRARRHSLAHVRSRSYSDWIDDDGALLVKVCFFCLMN
jgi:hypothetical protein